MVMKHGFNNLYKMKYIKLFENFMSLSNNDKEIYQKFTDKVLLIFNGEHCIDIIEQFDDQKYVVSLLKETPMKLNNGEVLTYDDLVDMIYHAEMEYRIISDGAYGIIRWINALNNLYDNGGNIFRVVFIKNLNSLNKDNIGHHWTYDSSFIYDYYLNYMYNYYTNHTNENKPYLITGHIQPQQNIKLGPHDRAEEGEIYIINPNIVEIKDIKLIDI